MTKGRIGMGFVALFALSDEAEGAILERREVIAQTLLPDAQVSTWQGATVALGMWPAPAPPFLSPPVLHGASTPAQCAVGCVGAMCGNRADLVTNWFKTRGPRGIVAHLGGAFALVFHERRLFRLTCFTDSAGLCTLFYFYSEKDNVFVVGTSAWHVARASGASARLRRGALASYLAAGRKSSVGSFFDGVRMLPPGRVLVLTGSRSRSWHRLSWSERRPDSIGANAVRRQLAKGVSRCIESTTSFWCDLSGGVDSTSVAAIAERMAASSGKTMILRALIDPARPHNSEWPYIWEALQKLRSEARLFSFSDGPTLLEGLGHIASPLPEPSLAILGSPYIATLGAAMAGTRSTIHLSGHGGDHVFSPPGLLHIWKILRQQGSPAAVREFLFWAHSPRGFWRTFTSRLLLPLWFDYASCNRPPLAPWLRHRLTMPIRLALKGAYRSSANDFVRRAHEAHVLHGAATGRDSATLSSAFGVETRFPFLDRGVVSFALGIGGEHLASAPPKSLLRRAMAPLLPQAILEKWRQPGGSLNLVFQIRRCQRELLDLVRRSALADYGLIEPRSALEHLTRLAQGDVSHSTQLAHLIAAELWMRSVFDRKYPAPTTPDRAYPNVPCPN